MTLSDVLGPFSLLQSCLLCVASVRLILNRKTKQTREIPFVIWLWCWNFFPSVTRADQTRCLLVWGEKGVSPGCQSFSPVYSSASPQSVTPTDQPSQHDRRILSFWEIGPTLFIWPLNFSSGPLRSYPHSDRDVVETEWLKVKNCGTHRHCATSLLLCHIYTV